MNNVRIMRTVQGERGFTLIELLVVAVVFALMVLMVDAVFAIVNRGSRTVEIASDVQQNARVAIERVSREAREARASLTTTGSTWVAFPVARPKPPNDVYFCVDASGVNDASCVPPGGNYKDTYGAVTQGWLVYWLDTSAPPGRGCADNTGVLLRDRRSSAPTGSPSTGDVADERGVIASCVRSFSALLSGTKLEVTLELATAGTVQGTVVPPQQVTLRSTTFIRN